MKHLLICRVPPQKKKNRAAAHTKRRLTEIQKLEHAKQQKKKMPNRRQTSIEPLGGWMRPLWRKSDQALIQRL